MNSIYNGSYGSERHVVLGGQHRHSHFIRLVKASHFYNLFVCQRTLLSSFISHVLNVVVLGPKEEMVWANTGRIVAAMKDKCASRDRANYQFVGHPVSQKRAFLHSGLSVTSSVMTGSPDPTGICLIDVTPEPVGNGFDFFTSRSNAGAMVRTPHLALFAGVKAVSTILASLGWGWGLVSHTEIIPHLLYLS